ncbi:MAG: toll/interleukin-1 receptor domain-containing protein, partial [Planctomycetota bacterium JB042]
MTGEDGTAAARVPPGDGSREPSRGERPGEVFLSWSGSARRLAEALSNLLQLVGVNPFLSQVSIKAGRRWEDELEKALAACDHAIILVTPDAVRSPWVMWEAGAIHNQPRPTRVFPVLVGVSEGPDPLRRLQAVSLQADLETDELKERVREVTKEVVRAVGKPSSAFQRIFDLYWDNELRTVLDETLVEARRTRTTEQLAIALSDAEANVRQLAEQMRILTATQDDPCYFMDASYNITLANIAAYLMFDLEVSDGRPRPIHKFIASIKGQLTNFDAMIENFNRKFNAKDLPPPRVDSEPAIFQHEAFGEVRMNKIGIAVPDVISRRKR